jgi:hypothetical protein
LALCAMTDGHDPRLAGHFRAQRPAAATGDPSHHRKPPLFCVVATLHPEWGNTVHSLIARVAAGLRRKRPFADAGE